MSGSLDAAEVLGDSLIPVINRLQDIFSQVRHRSAGAGRRRSRICAGGGQLDADAGAAEDGGDLG